mmetsp:Transcript_18660/g.28348  ORF Transcript_18660/g.28348 Transcript_18660/m.28348 type:complete len:822 (+) Transcript_18660:94-2559(+)
MRFYSIIVALLLLESSITNAKNTIRSISETRNQKRRRTQEENKCKPAAGTCNAQCTPYRSPDSCADDESFPLLIQRRTRSFTADPGDAYEAGYFINHLEDKLKGYLFSTRHAKVRAPKIYYCTTSNELDVTGLSSFDHTQYSETGFVIRATNLHSNQGVLVFPNGLDGVELINNIVMNMDDVVTYLVSLKATKVIIEEYINGQGTPSVAARRKLEDTPEPACAICDDKLTNWMKENNATCTSSPGTLASKCNKDKSWKEHKFCQLSCSQAGRAYDGDACCESTENAATEVSSVGPCEEKWRCGNHAEDYDPNGPRKYNVCHVNGGGHENTICIPETSAHLFPDKKPDNYCGFCDATPRIDEGSPNEDCSSLPTEYKVHVFNDRIGSINIVHDRGCDCACWAEIDAEWNRLDQHGCFTPSSEGEKAESGCTAIDFNTGKDKAHPMKGLDICGPIEKPDDCIIQDIIDVAKKIGRLVGAYVRVDLFISSNGEVIVQEYSTNHMNGLRHCSAKVDGGCINSCFLGQMWKAAGGHATYGGPATSIPEVITLVNDMSEEDMCQYAMDTVIDYTNEKSNCNLEPPTPSPTPPPTSPPTPTPTKPVTVPPVPFTFSPVAQSQTAPPKTATNEPTPPPTQEVTPAPTSPLNTNYCDTYVGGCVEVVQTSECAETVTYCLQDKASNCADGGSTCQGNEVCKSNPGGETYSHINVYVNGETSVQATSSCAEMKECDAHSNKGCDLTDLDNTVGLKCENEKGPVCVTVPIDDDGNHAEVIFSVKDKSTCNDDDSLLFGDDLPWKCFDHKKNNCGCGGIACVLGGLRNCNTLN